MRRSWSALLVLTALVVSRVLAAAGPDPEIIRAVVGPKTRDAIRGRQIFDFAGSGGTRSPAGPRLYEQTVNSIVLIGTEEGSIGGGGFISREGFVVTNWHVVNETPYVGIWLKYNTSSLRDASDKNMIIGEVAAIDRLRDLALVRMIQEPPRMKPWLGIRPLALGDLSQIKVGQDVFAIGHPKEFLWSYTEGVVSQIRYGHAWKDRDGNEYRATLIQSQTPISPGSSGAPLFDTTGRVIGITSATAQGAQNLNFAIAVNEILDFLRQHSKLR